MLPTMTTRRTVLAGTAALVVGPAVAATADYWPGATDWAGVEPGPAGFDPVKLSTAIDIAMADRSNSVVVLRGGRRVVERYATGITPASRQEVASTAKSIISVLVGIAIDMGRIKSVDQGAADFIPQWRNTPQAAITLRHMLTMTSGQDFRNLALRGVAGDQFAINAAAPQAVSPGTRWAYDTATFHLLYHVIARAAGEPFEAFAQRNLLDRLGMMDTGWVTNLGQSAGGPVTNYYTARCSARDLARFGLFAQRGGRWAGQQIVSAAYLRAATSPSQDLNPAYGYLWWNNAKPGRGAGVGAGGTEASGYRFEGSPRDTFAAMGAGGQVVMVVPSLDLVVVRQGQNPGGTQMLPTLLASVRAAVEA